ncbi:hypothetical protein HYU22_05600 [Candidatus Woesearchaeota archaeon]|nr:hypothetical protein [Candidatus Woesearchaeota archaeon]
MEPVEYIMEGMKWVAVGGVSYIGALWLIDGIHDFGPRVRSQEELEKMVEEEAPKLGLNHLKIDAKYDGETVGARKNGERYDLHLVGDGDKIHSSSTRATVRHELYHLLKDSDKGKLNPLYYFFVAEPRALLYGAFKIKM